MHNHIHVFAVFQSTSPQGRRHNLEAIRLKDSEFQSTSPQGRRLNLIILGTDWWLISIHVSARETTPFIYDDSLSIYISIHVSARETTSNNGTAVEPVLISIHVSARETTVGCHMISTRNYQFQSTSPQGRRHKGAMSLS